MLLGGAARCGLCPLYILAEPPCRHSLLPSVGRGSVCAADPHLQLYRCPQPPEPYGPRRGGISGHKADPPACRHLLRTPLLWLAGASVLVIRCPGGHLLLPGVPAVQADALAAILTEEPS